MASDSSDNYKIDARAIGIALIQLSPIVLVVIYILEYTYVYQVLVQFGLAPEEIGVSEIKLLTRAALLTLLVVSVIGVLFVAVGSMVILKVAIEESRQVRRIRSRLNKVHFVRSRNIIRSPTPRNRKSAIENAWTASHRAEIVRNSATLSFGIVLALAIIAVKPFGVQLSITTTVALALIGAALCVALFLGWKNKSIKYLTYLCGAVSVVVLLGLTAIFGGANMGYKLATTGRATFVDILGVDILQVHPKWLDKSVVPLDYAQTQDLLELGSDGATAFLYDCRTATTYRIPLADVLLTYPTYLNYSSSATLRRLRC